MQNNPPTNTFIQGDCLETLKTVPDNSIGLIVTSPPYNIRNSTGGRIKANGGGSFMGNSELLSKGYDGFSDDLPYDEYKEQQRAVIKECLRVLRKDGALYYNHRVRTQNGIAQDPMVDFLKGMPVRQIIVWEKGDGPNHNRRFFLPTHENIYLIVNPDFKLKHKGQLPGTVWRIGRERRNPHPAPFPLELPRRCIESSQFTGPVMDPYMGSGTTALAAQQLGHQWVGIEQSAKYIEDAKRRLAGMPICLPKREKTPAPSPKVNLSLFRSPLNAAEIDFLQKKNNLSARIQDVNSLLKQCKETPKTRRYTDLFNNVKRNLWTLGAFIDDTPCSMEDDNPALVALAELYSAAYGKGKSVKQVPSKAKAFLELVSKRLEALLLYDTLTAA